MLNVCLAGKKNILIVYDATAKDPRLIYMENHRSFFDKQLNEKKEIF